jgi:predicted acyltransferase
MEKKNAVAVSSSSTRVVSVDALRGVVITLMIFVNDVAGVVAETRVSQFRRHDFA